ncbi:MAG: SCP2 sterol-binding domain-containing protein [Candidatus Methylomirabilis sp.]|nr:SCP2 sterol-binding domain-containing protein [Deltaproteobacteria bacterium]
MEKEEAKKKLREGLYKGLRLPLKAMPLWMEAIGMGVFISAILDKNPAFRARLGEIDGKLFLFEARDVEKKFFLHVKDRDVKVVPHSTRVPDVTMSGSASVLMEVLLGKEDPDTVFFSRKLEITGDTAAAIHFKNLLASLG